MAQAGVTPNEIAAELEKRSAKPAILKLCIKQIKTLKFREAFYNGFG
jgi:hypothetical protein